MKINYKNLITGLLILFLIQARAFAQVEIQGSQYLIDKTYINPAFSGRSGLVDANTSFQLREVNQNPGKSYNICAAGNFFLTKAKSGIGLNIISMKFGNDRYTTAYTNYAYHLKISEDVTLSSGLSIGLQQFQINSYDLTAIENDPASGKNVYSSKMNARYGLAAFFKERYYVGLSFDNILSLYTNKQDFENQIPPMFRKISMYVVGGGSLMLDQVKLEPGFLIMKTFSGTSAYDLNLFAALTKELDAGIGFRHLTEMKNVESGIRGNGQSSFRPMLQFRVNPNANKRYLKVGYAYNFSIGREAGLNTGSHDISLLFNMGK